ncbi:MAG: glycoside hydrolase family 3 N-terminal domain-containing protein [Labedaea sp.]
MGRPAGTAAVALAAAVVLCGSVGAPVASATAQSAQDLAGQRVIYSYPGLVPPDTLLQRIRAGQAAGVIFFGENISSLSQIRSVVGQLRAAAAQSPVRRPLLLMTDQEGGQVRRLPGEPVLSEKQVGLAADPPAQARAAGTGAGDNLAGVTMNVNLAPVLDVYRRAGDLMDQFGRSYSMNAGAVSTLGGNFVSTQQATGVAATVKHFPGLGSASAAQNTDTRAVTLPVGLSTLRNVDEAPYRTAIAAGAKLVMLSWAVYPALDSTRPAGLSSLVVQQELRQRNGFGGVTITDALEAGALGSFGSTGNRAVLAARAGMDLILASARSVGQGDAAVNAMAAALDGGTLDQASFAAAVARVDALRDSLR